MHTIQKILHSARLIGAGNVVRSIRYAIRRNRLDARYAPRLAQDALISVGKLLCAEPFESGARFTYEHGQLTARFLADDFIFLAWDGAKMSPSYAVVKEDWTGATADLQPSDRGWSLHSPALTLNATQDGSLNLLNSSGKLLRKEKPIQRNNQGWQHQVHLSPEACIYGLGERSVHLNLRPGAYRFWNMDAGGHWSFGQDPLYICMPIYLCLHDAGSYLVFYDNTFDGDLRLDETATIQFRGGPARYYIAVGSPRSLLQRLSELTGRPPLPPRWAFGFQQSRWGYMNEDELRRVYAGFRQHELPISALVMDADHMRGYRTFTTDPSRYPNLVAFAKELAENDVHLVASVNPAIKVESGFDLYEDGLRQDVFAKTPDGKVVEGVVWPGWAAFTDFTNPRVRAWWGQQYNRHIKDGIDGFWHDMNEPSSFAAFGEITLPRSTVHDLDGRHGSHQEAHNLYGLLMNEAAYDGLRQLRPNQRPFILSRSGWVGLQRSAWCWTGDVETSWQALRQTIAYVLGLGLSGVPYSGPDIGGFSGAPSPELYVRWFQLSAFLPFFRSHCAFYLPRREPWEFGEGVLSILRRALELRYSMLPYWYTLAWQASQSGYPLVRPLFWDEPDHASIRNIDDAFKLGGDLLVAPVVEQGVSRRSLLLPSGGWYELANDHFHPGGASIEMDAPLEAIPVLVRAGAILPLARGNRLELHLYRPLDGENGNGMLYNDLGDGYGPWRLETFDLQPTSGGYEFNWRSQGAYAWPYQETTLHLHGFQCQQSQIKIQPGQHFQVPEIEPAP